MKKYVSIVFVVLSLSSCDMMKIILPEEVNLLLMESDRVNRDSIIKKAINLELLETDATKSGEASKK